VPRNCTGSAAFYIVAKGGTNHGNESYNQNHERSSIVHVNLYRCACRACSIGKTPILLVVFATVMQFNYGLACLANVAAASCSGSILLHPPWPLTPRRPVELRHSLANVTICARVIDCASSCLAVQSLLMVTPIYAPTWCLLALRASIALPPKAHGNSFLAIPWVCRPPLSALRPHGTVCVACFW